MIICSLFWLDDFMRRPWRWRPSVSLGLSQRAGKFPDALARSAASVTESPAPCASSGMVRRRFTGARPFAHPLDVGLRKPFGKLRPRLTEMQVLRRRLTDQNLGLDPGLRNYILWHSITTPAIISARRS